MVVVVVAVGLAACTGLREANRESSTTRPEASTTTLGPLPEEGASSSTSPVELESAPWSGSFLDVDQAEPLLVEAWSESLTRHTCSLIAPADLGAEGVDAVPRSARSPPGEEVFVAWDNPDGPGMTGDSQLCENCGRSAFGISLLGRMPEFELESRVQALGPFGSTWADGSQLWFEPKSEAREDYADGHHRVFGNLLVGHENCLYHVWSSLGEDHLMWFVDQLRLVEGHVAEFAGESPPTLEIDGGPPPWNAVPLTDRDVEPLLLERWDETGRHCPLLTFADMGPELEDATIRTANIDGYGVAWDTPSGYGHDGFGQPCSDCGRGAAGLTGRRADERYSRVDWAFRVVWSDGSFAEYGSPELAKGVAEEELRVPDANTGDPATFALHAFIAVADQPECGYEVWTHHGKDHLHYLFTQLRYVTGHP